MNSEEPEGGMRTSLKLDAPPDSVVRGSIVSFTGRLVSAEDGVGLGGLTVEIMDNDIDADDLLGDGTTDREGRFTVEWLAKPTDPLDDTVEVYARFPGHTGYTASRAPDKGNHTVRVIDDPRRKKTSTEQEHRTRTPPPIR